MSIQDKATIITCIIASLTFLSGIQIFLFRIANRFKRLEDRDKIRKQENTLLIKSTFAVCDGLHQLGCNGPVTKAREELQQYIIEN